MCEIAHYICEVTEKCIKSDGTMKCYSSLFYLLFYVFLMFFHNYTFQYDTFYWSCCPCCCYCPPNLSADHIMHLLNKSDKQPDSARNPLLDIATKISQLQQFPNHVVPLTCKLIGALLTLTQYSVYGMRCSDYAISP